ncbi:MAG: hypothetical protein IPP27_15320 [Bacteroidetes bacterium]|nr:hypothetical protein [Bacteroidota bacterium]
MCSIPIKTTKPLVLKSLLYEKYRIEVPVMVHGNTPFSVIPFRHLMIRMILTNYILR